MFFITAVYTYLKIIFFFCLLFLVLNNCMVERLYLFISYKNEIVAIVLKKNFFEYCSPGVEMFYFFCYQQSSVCFVLMYWKQYNLNLTVIVRLCRDIYIGAPASTELKN